MNLTSSVFQLPLLCQQSGFLESFQSLAFSAFRASQSCRVRFSQLTSPPHKDQHRHYLHHSFNMPLGKVTRIQPPQVPHDNEFVIVIVGTEIKATEPNTTEAPGSVKPAATTLLEAPPPNETQATLLINDTKTDTTTTLPVTISPTPACRPTREYAIHKNLICASADFFDRAFNGRFVEGREQKLTLPEEDPLLFQLFYDWLYSGRVDGKITT